MTQPPEQPPITEALADQDQQVPAREQDQAADEDNEESSQTPVPPSAPSPAQAKGFNWLALGVVIIIAAFFALTARFNVQPAASFVPIAVLSATGCGLLVTALYKLRSQLGAGILEAAIGGFFLALFQCAVALTYPGIFDTLTTNATLARGFLTTWGLIVVFSILASIGGAAIGHLAFAPTGSLAAKKTSLTEEDAPEIVALAADTQETDEGELAEDDEAGSPDKASVSSNDPEEESESAILTPSRSTLTTLRSLLVAIVLLALAPTMIGYVLAAAYDFTLNAEQFSPGIYPTLRLLSALLPWQTPISINLSGANGTFILFVLLWRIPLMLGNASTFDVQSLEPYIFNSAALALLLLTLRKTDATTDERIPLLRWPTYFLLEAVLGLLLVTPANIWMVRGLQGLLQTPTFVVPLPTLPLLTPLTFALNFITGPLVCLLVGLILHRQYALWTGDATKASIPASTSI